MSALWQPSRMTTDLSPGDVVALLAREKGLRLTLDGRFDRGYHGAYAVTSDLEDRYVLKWQPWSVGLDDSHAQTYERFSRLRARGIPIPNVVDAGRVGEVWFELQEFVVGEHFEKLTAPVLDQLLAVVAAERGAGLRADGWRERLEGLSDEGTPIDSPEAFVNGSRRTRRLVERAQQIVQHSDLAEMHEGDIVHGDFSQGNVLTRGDHVTAIVDWADSVDGDASFDLFTLAWEVQSSRRATPSLATRLENEIAATTPPAVAGFYAAHVCTGSLGWAFGTKFEERIVAHAEKFLARWSQP